MSMQRKLLMGAMVAGLLAVCRVSAHADAVQPVGTYVARTPPMS
jgi:hypothetical protein